MVPASASELVEVSAGSLAKLKALAWGFGRDRETAGRVASERARRRGGRGNSCECYAGDRGILRRIFSGPHRGAKGASLPAEVAGRGCVPKLVGGWRACAGRQRRAFSTLAFTAGDGRERGRLIPDFWRRVHKIDVVSRRLRGAGGR